MTKMVASLVFGQPHTVTVLFKLPSVPAAFAFDSAAGRSDSCQRKSKSVSIVLSYLHLLIVTFLLQTLKLLLQ